MIPDFALEMNSLGKNKTPFVFVIDFEMKKPIVLPTDSALKYGILFNLKGKTNYKKAGTTPPPEIFNSFPISIEEYKPKFDLVKENILKGNSYLLNLTCPTKIETDLEFTKIFKIAKAPYKLLKKDDFLVFSPECFVRIEGNNIFSYPMKGTIDADIPGAADKLLANKKELYEHNTIVDLIRNDLAISAEKIKVTKFRFLDKIKTNRMNLLQMSSEIRGELPENWNENIGEIIWRMLPAGSISGAPKEKTCEIIRQAEGKYRGWYTGIWGLYDGVTLDSAVNIRYIEKTPTGLIFRSGGGITALSDCEEEYEEMKAKVYVPGI
jgi:para-aminobenzoate synthetase component I